MPDWLQETLNALPAILWMICGIGLPWALVALPRRDWRDFPMTAALALLFGPALLTLWMFILGTVGQNHDPHAGDTLNPMQTTLMTHIGGQNLLRPGFILGGSLVIALVGWGILFFRYRAGLRPAPTESPGNVGAQYIAPSAVSSIEYFLIFLIVIATMARWFITSWLPFGAWDELWVYGYQGRIYTLVGYIPADIGYYPQFLPLQYAYLQIVSAGHIADHAARAVIPFLQVGSILAVYVLGSRLFYRRVGIIAAALWALYPHFGYWTRIGDLETPLTFSFTLSAAFFLMAWTQPARGLRRHYALLAGLCFGVALWTKPTAGAFVWGVLLLVAVQGVMAFLKMRIFRANPPRNVGAQYIAPMRDVMGRGMIYHAPMEESGLWQRFEVAFITGIACIPLGGLWYIRNILKGHDAVVLPPPFWLTQSMRSGAEFGWLLLALVLLLMYLYIGRRAYRPGWRGVLLGVILVALGVVPTILSPARMGFSDWLALTAGIVILAAALGDYALSMWSTFAENIGDTLSKIGWALLLALPYFITWFYSYSYHYRLSFAIVPLMILPSAVILVGWFTPERIARWNFPRRFAFTLMVFLVALPGVGIAIYDEGLGWDWLWTIPPEGDYSKAGLLGVVETLQDYVDETGELPVVVAPGLQPLPFFFPTANMDVVSTPRRLADVQGVTHFVNSRVAVQAYEESKSAGGTPFFNQFFTSLPRDNVATLVGQYADDAFFYDIYRLHAEDRFIRPEIYSRTDEYFEVDFGQSIRYAGHNINGLNRFGVPVDTALGRIYLDIEIELIWYVLQTPLKDYGIYLHLIRENDPSDVVYQWDGVVDEWRFGYYSTRLWEPGEYIIDHRTLNLDPSLLTDGETYQLRFGFYDLETGARLPVSVDGALAGDGYLLETPLMLYNGEE